MVAILASLGPVYEFVTVHLEQIISTVLGQVDHGGQDGNAARTRTGTKHPKPTTPQNDAFAMVLSAEQ